MITFAKALRICAGAFIAICAVPAFAQDSWSATYSLYGTSGIIDLPSAIAPADAELAATVATFGKTQRTTLSFQVLPRITGSFRYSQIDTYDRSFDIQYQITGEGRFRPAFAIGLRDFLGTGLYSSEYIVGTKRIHPNVRVTGGLGWGRLGSADGFTNPLGILDDRFETRPGIQVETGGTILANQFFRGDAAFFGGVEWRLNDAWTVMSEYSTDAYNRETRLIGFERRSPWNFGAEWRPNPTYQLNAHYMYGSEIGVSGTIVIDPKTTRYPSGLETAPAPVIVRSRETPSSWSTFQAQEAGINRLGAYLAIDGFRLLSAEVSGDTIRLRYENKTYRAEAQGVGRVARLLTHIAPANVSTFILEPSRLGIALSSVTLQRADIEQLENTPNAAALSYDRATFGDGSDPAPAINWDDKTPAFVWGIVPYSELSLFGGDMVAHADVGLEASFKYEFQSNVVLAGAYRQRVLGNRDDIGFISPSTLPPVRREALYYGAENGGGIEDLTLSLYGHPTTNFYSRMSIGYLERMFGGVSGEVLWKPVDSRVGLGAEVNYVAQRDFDLGFGFQDYNVVTGHLSGYYDLDNGFQAQVDVGRYLAGDWGATISLDREFENGWKVGAYFTMTDVSFEEFGEGSFDKGVHVEIPTDWLFGTPSRRTLASTLSSLSRDGGARLQIDGRLYDVVEDAHQRQMVGSWGRFWR
jgi:hypothetical protein